jgi:SAM-dependent methyltransferase
MIHLKFQISKSHSIFEHHPFNVKKQSSLTSMHRTKIASIQSMHFSSITSLFDNHKWKMCNRNITKVKQDDPRLIFTTDKKNVKLSIKSRMEARKMDSYGELSSECYGIWFPENEEYEDAKLYEKYILQKQGQPALELGCGDGRLLIPYVKKGLEVEGLDLSPHMIERCRAKADKFGIKLNLHQQAMQKLDLPKKYGTIFIPFGSFMLIHEEKDALEALRRFYQHLKPEGSLLISFFIPTKCDILVDAAPQNEWRLRREGRRSNGDLVQCWEKAKFDTDKQIEHSEYRYDVIDQGRVVSSEEESLKLRWYTQEQFHRLLQDNGFTSIKALKGHSDIPALPQDDEFTFVCQKS